MKTSFYSITLLGLCVILPSKGFSQEINDSSALENLSTGKVLWDITIDNPKKLALYLSVIKETYEGLLKQNVSPDMIFTFHGGVVKLISTNPEKVPLEDHDELDKVQQLLNELQKKEGVKMESCSIATRLFGIDNKTILEGIKPVGNTFISIIGYHSKGYAVIPIN
jgi:predicted peroxiredoxin